MKINTVRIKNFRGYKEETEIRFKDLNVIVGKNDVGKSTILEALDIFFNEGKGVVKMDKDDINKLALSEDNNEISISIVFEDLPDSLIIDSTNETSLSAEYILNSSNYLEVIKKYPNAGKEKVFLKANHPSNVSCENLLLKTQRELQRIITSNSISCENQTKNSVMRAAIWKHFEDDLQLTDIEIDVTKVETKSIWEKLKNYLPLYTLFQSDRKNSDGDSEVQDPMKLAVQEILKNEDLRNRLDIIAREVETKLISVANQTLSKIKEMNPDIVDSLNPVIPNTDSLKWADVFKNVSITGDNDIPINKRGSGVKRLILLNFFRAEAERRCNAGNMPSIIYAIEEPETSQHTEFQRKLIKAFDELSTAPNTQIILTTHSTAIVKELKFEDLRMVTDNDGIKCVDDVQQGQLPYPSLNEVNYLAFNEITEEYHNELYGFLEYKGLLNDFKREKSRLVYNRLFSNGNTREEQKILTEYIRHQIHHPENTLNTRYTDLQLEESIILMRNFIKTNDFVTESESIASS